MHSHHLESFFKIPIPHPNRRDASLVGVGWCPDIKIYDVSPNDSTTQSHLKIHVLGLVLASVTHGPNLALVNHVSLDPSHAHSLHVPVATFSSQQQSWVVVTETLLPAKSKIFCSLVFPSLL